MRLGDLIAEIFATLLAISVVAVLFFMGGKPLWPDNQAKMVIVLSPDAMTTASIRSSARPHLPEKVDAELLRPRPFQD
ncbi:polymerase [Mesorhizobium sp. M4B.F.Ca.ET.017.02.2.1]|uniref:polymerase n=1 Tax=Mesorhizobium sp. M4B.F.Ca.ET.017.02.2.1 TaxID=2496649 RepID=UPI000FCB4F5F|nr:polymerase [Mesorhizobium sp. M4B.F.Ca.ET.017.02.2.1]RVD17001.1 polymerase [Mesorhizobium sp. M4B.F.Ca.ET.017.02.2.1]